MKKKSMIAVPIVASLVLASAFLHLYYIQEGSSEKLLWNKDEAYLFVSVSQSGWRVSCLRYLRAVIEELIPGGSTPNSESRGSTIVFRLTSETVQRYEPQDISVGEFTPLGKTIYANHEGKAMKWSGEFFEPASPQEQERLDNSHLQFSYDFTDVNGWSRRYNVIDLKNEETKFTIELDGKPLTFVGKYRHVNRLDSESSIDLLRPGRPPERLWYTDARLRRVSKTEYQHTFQTR